MAKDDGMDNRCLYVNFGPSRIYETTCDCLFLTTTTDASTRHLRAFFPSTRPLLSTTSFRDLCPSDIFHQNLSASSSKVSNVSSHTLGRCWSEYIPMVVAVAVSSKKYVCSWTSWLFVAETVAPNPTIR